ncbi:hypothetical protein H310_08720 [Aphanomyces invadans]|uniref:Uncharacterized protein n=1 Tax=Aphanomyces invadans TaxID=157072 RepID=A0A024TZ19_9STRA|nr:hypothetical protein H310_08720 [Aphanomyces invadans]ETV98602.1 hypothetical protein H310_08720 [Aphanomyces invadans]|eukprot:XP_008872799.1 hypothetical protein H310_08720 [Aphanomyces invadans]
MDDERDQVEDDRDGQPIPVRVVKNEAFDFERDRRGREKVCGGVEHRNELVDERIRIVVDFLVRGSKVRAQLYEGHEHVGGCQRNQHQRGPEGRTQRRQDMNRRKERQCRGRRPLQEGSRLAEADVGASSGASTQTGHSCLALCVAYG